MVLSTPTVDLDVKHTRELADFSIMENKKTPAEEINIKKKSLQLAVSKLILDFANETGATVSQIQFTYENNPLDNRKKLLKADAQIDIS